ncbi:tetratricopeptide repeat protein [Parabacteroides johnsonii DSM 18315]|jgi:tetratricopeptide (TPR) repeat protein|uniref:Tetratricopeptide repeat protein n=3 Tax=Parabacteroides johnsonii TaxID=387661 RepID=B7B6R7_9BACT|nr:RagB/SusD family nutrient uptake outer membrane protein [Parabacteroides johnsonii]EEC97885.1 tetratricopeptide repeat protein [Parabacteroides johnsonii DSM 18315]UEA90224.1 RagB/SusD family nutrient uptake outer membrane protein [Parabacteroides johnsonii]UWP42386.1 RagB/SusD family nutrient uptake outer membrane protein [Parabacteroides johnsonii DSM 18315]HJG98444.1 RagB/SusD family nutrient uptake outer membrane protein [Parabacteroides johnsonii]
MKKIIIYLATMLLAAMTFTGCYDLETYPGDKVNEGTFYKTGDHAHQGLMGIYGMLRLNEAYGYQFCFDHLGDIAYGYNYYMMFLATYTDRDGTIQAHWQTFYDGIHRVNTFIRSVKGMGGIITDEQINEYVAEAKFLRAMFYFSLTDLFGGVPYYDESTNVNEEFMNLKQPRSSLEEVRAHILEDLDEAIKYLPVEHAASEYGRATKGAAYALRGKVYLYDKEWQSAINDFEEIVYNKSNNYGYDLDDDYARVFKLYNGAKSPETVFSIQNKSGVGTEYGMQIQALMGCRGAYGSCWNNTVPSTQLVDMYEFKDGRPFNWDEIFPGYNAMTPEQRKELLSVEMDGAGAIVGLREADTAKILSAYTCRDPRLMATVIVPYSHYMGNIGRTTNVDLIFALDHNLSGNANGGTIQNNAGWVSYLYRKFVTEGDQGGAISNRLHTPFAFPLIRFADVLLMLSEAYNEAGQLDKAVIEFNKVRTRVGMPGLNSGPEWMVVSNKEQMAERIRKERAVEFAGEGLRFSDLRRWGYEIAHKTLNNVDAVNIYGEPIYTHLFTERDMLWPIPGVERERNDALTQNPGW